MKVIQDVITKQFHYVTTTAKLSRIQLIPHFLYKIRILAPHTTNIFIVCFNELKLFVKFGKHLCESDVLSAVTINNEEFHRSLDLCVS